jgi:large subunit ribosomal protein L10
VEKAQKEQLVRELTEKLRATDTLIVADYRGLTNKQLEALRAQLVGHGARLSIVKNTLTRRAAQAAGAETLLALLEGPTAIAFIESEGDPAAVAKALAETARDTKVLSLKGGVLQGAVLSGDQVEELAKLPPVDVLRGQLLGVVIAPLTQLAALVAAPLRDLVGLIDARIEQLQGQGETPAKHTEVEAGDSAAEPPGEGVAAITEPEADDSAAGEEEPAADQEDEDTETATTSENEEA